MSGSEQENDSLLTVVKLVAVVTEACEIGSEGCHGSALAATSADAAPQFIHALGWWSRSAGDLGEGLHLIRLE